MKVRPLERNCTFIKEDGTGCGAPRLTDGEFCFWHSPDHATERAEAARLGGLRRRREKTVAAAYDLEGLDGLQQVRRLVNIAALDTLGLENAVARNRTLAYLAMVLLKTLEVGELQERLEALEGAVIPRLRPVPGRKR